MPAITFTVTRTGDLTKPGSVNWTLEGDVPDADLAPGQAKTGALNWAANEAASKNVVVNTVGNSVVNPDRTCRLRLSAPVNAVLGTAAATTTILDDDAPAGVLPAGYPPLPNFAGASAVTVNTRAELQNAINSTPTTGPGRVITVAAGVDYGAGGRITVDRPGARIKIVAETPRFPGLITARSILDSRDLTVRSNADPVTLDNCVVGGRNGMRAHGQNARISLIASRCGVLWLEGLDIWNAGHSYEIVGQVVDELWLRKCSFDQSNGHMTLCGGTSGAGPRVFVAWECYHFGNGVTTDTGTSGTVSGVGVLTDYPYQMYNVGRSYFYKNVWDGGYNHIISSKLNCDEMRVDDCVFAHYHPQPDSWKDFELGQEGSGGGNLDRTCRLFSVRGSTFTVPTGTNSFGLIMAKDITGVLVEGNIIYAGGYLFNVGPAPNTGGVVRSRPADSGVLAGSDDFTVRNNVFAGTTPGSLGRPGACTLNAMLTGPGAGGYTFRASNNDVSASRAVNRGAKVASAYGPNAGFTG